ncbi:MerR family transcriptional regulator [Amycolatopsis cynarae]|uniref:MerR family transcriptional regulator n=1 Tax=Amycolatopsis cynarae TaxID=2995223 RepID=A0ABY7B8K3_9PSEU|nr:MerR family transcriptional regulator [Amycolatopsis sp. HUAS 11-8]WAL68685.1 MerR family transcriptional regulator [Amycolatopsis sp. HUAS 11-8]
MRITEAARATGTTARALRWYEQHGLLDPPRTTAGYRDYGQRELHRIRSIQLLQATGFTLTDLATFVTLLDEPVPDRLAGNGPASPRCATAIATTRARLATLERHLIEITALRDRLATLLDDRPESAEVDQLT